MTQRVDLILAEARTLTPDERETLLVRLEQLLCDHDDPADGSSDAEGTPEEIEEAWLDEVHRRAAAAKRGETTFVPAAELHARLHRRLHGHDRGPPRP